MSCEEHGALHADQLYARSDALATELETLLAGRPLDVVMCAMGLALTTLLNRSVPIPESNEKTIKGFASANVIGACTGCYSTRRHKVLYAHLLTYSLSYLATLFNLQCEHVAPKEG